MLTLKSYTVVWCCWHLDVWGQSCGWWLLQPCGVNAWGHDHWAAWGHGLHVMHSKNTTLGFFIVVAVKDLYSKKAIIIWQPASGRPSGSGAERKHWLLLKCMLLPNSCMCCYVFLLSASGQRRLMVQIVQDHTSWLLNDVFISVYNQGSNGSC